jgi:hypothetical protein
LVSFAIVERYISGHVLRRRTCRPPYYDPKGESPLSLYATVPAEEEEARVGKSRKEEVKRLIPPQAIMK